MARHKSRYDPYRSQVRDQGNLRYGPQESALAMLLSDAGQQLDRTSRGQLGSSLGIIQGVREAQPQIDKAYEVAGLTPQVRANLGNDPAGRRLAESLAAAHSDLTQRGVQAREGAAYAIRQAANDYGQTVQRIGQQRVALGSEKGLYESGLLDQLIGSDRAQRQRINATTRTQRFTGDQKALDRANSRGNALVGKGIDPKTGNTLPGLPSKSKSAGPKRATPASQSKAASELNRALREVKLQAHGEVLTPALRKSIGDALLSGDPGLKPQPKYDPKTGKKLIGKDGLAVMQPGAPPLKAFQDPHVVSAALDLVFGGHLSRETVQRFHGLGLSVKALGVDIGSRSAKPRRRPQTKTPPQSSQPGAPGWRGQSRPG